MFSVMKQVNRSTLKILGPFRYIKIELIEVKTTEIPLKIVKNKTPQDQQLPH